MRSKKGVMGKVRVVILDQRSPRGGAHHNRTLPPRVDVRHARAHPRSSEGFLVRLCVVALLVIIYRQPRALLAPSFRDHGNMRVCRRRHMEEAPRQRSFHLRHGFRFAHLSVKAKGQIRGGLEDR